MGPSSDRNKAAKCCTLCGKEYPNTLEYFHKHGKYLTSWCKACRIKKQRAYDIASKEKDPEGFRKKRREQKRKRKCRYPDKTQHLTRKYNLKQFYGITLEQYDVMLEEQNGVCAICGQLETWRDPNGETRRLSVDHDHDTGETRGLLCSICNLLVGKVEKYPKRMLKIQKYLAR